MQQSDEEGRIPKNAREGVSGDSSAATEVVADGSIPHSNASRPENSDNAALPSQSDDTDSQSSTDSAETYSTDSPPPLQESLKRVFVWGVGTNAPDIIGNETAYENLKRHAIAEATSAIANLQTAETARAERRGARAELEWVQTHWLKLGDPDFGIAVDDRLAALDKQEKTEQ